MTIERGDIREGPEKGNDVPVAETYCKVRRGGES